jgi:glycine reductase
MHPDNAGVLTYRREIVAVPTGSESTEMVEALQRMSRLALKLLSGEELGPASEDGYIPRGFRRQVIHPKRGCERAVDMLNARLSRRPWVSEMLITSYDVVPPAQPVKDARQAQVALVTTGGLVPRGNKDRQVGAKAEKCFRYGIEGTKALSPEEWESVHDGFNTATLNRENPNYAMPLSYARYLEETGELAGIYPFCFCTTGNATAVSVARRMGSEIAEELKQNHVDGALLVAT